MAALTTSRNKLDELWAIEWRIAIEERARAAFLHGAEDDSRATLGRPLTQDELLRLLLASGFLIAAVMLIGMIETGFEPLALVSAAMGLAIAVVSFFLAARRAR